MQASNIPLALAGAGYALLQILLKPRLSTLLKRLLLAATFLLIGKELFQGSCVIESSTPEEVDNP
jgi:hypothetical protein